MKRTKVWWSKLTTEERSFIMYYDKASKNYGSYGSGGYLPDDCSECPVCGQAMLGSGTCRYCNQNYDEIINKANNACMRSGESK